MKVSKSRFSKPLDSSDPDDWVAMAVGIEVGFSVSAGSRAGVLADSGRIGVTIGAVG